MQKLFPVHYCIPMAQTGAKASLDLKFLLSQWTDGWIDNGHAARRRDSFPRKIRVPFPEGSRNEYLADKTTGIQDRYCHYPHEVASALPTLGCRKSKFRLQDGPTLEIKQVARPITFTSWIPASLSESGLAEASPGW
jgi:hypothetical protein